CRGPDEVDNRQRSARRDRKERLVLSAVFAASALRRVFQEAIMKPMCIGLLFLVAAGSAGAQDPLSGARELYASAAYEDALTTLTKLHASDTAASNIEQIDQYRAFCLFALGRVAEAQTLAENLISKNPLLEVNTTDASPRITAMFADARKKLLPGLIRDQYRGARSALDRKDYAAAEPQLKQVRKMIEEAERIGAVDDALADLRVLTDGFLDLAHAGVGRAAVPATPENGTASAATTLPTGNPAAPRREDAAAAVVPARIYDHTA